MRASAGAMTPHHGLTSTWVLRCRCPLACDTTGLRARVSAHVAPRTSRHFKLKLNLHICFTLQTFRSFIVVLFLPLPFYLILTNQSIFVYNEFATQLHILLIFFHEHDMDQATMADTRSGVTSDSPREPDTGVAGCPLLWWLWICKFNLKWDEGLLQTGW